MSRRLTQRDLEIIRTLVRVQFATTASLQRTFFPDLRLARRRLATLRNTYGVITPHAKGLPGAHDQGSRPYYWRLTETGLGVFREHFPAARVPENHVTRTRNASLRFFEHRNATTDLYLALIGTKDQHVDELRSRADAMDWRAEYDVTLEYQSVEGARHKQRKVVPDATLTTPHARVFIEADRSTESLGYCKRSLAAYVNAVGQPAYQRQFADNLPIVVLYATETQARAENLRGVMDTFTTLPFRAEALPMHTALKWLSASLATPPGPVLPSAAAVASEPAVASTIPEDARRAFVTLYNVCNELCKVHQHLAADPPFTNAIVSAFPFVQSPGRGVK